MGLTALDFGQYVFAEPYIGWMCRGVVMTLMITAATTVGSVVLGGLVGTMRLSRMRTWRFAGRLYVEVFRNLPPLPLLLFLLFALPGLFRSTFGYPMPTGLEFHLLVFGLSLNSSAYIAEILRSGAQAIPAEQWDAGRVLGLRRCGVLIFVIYPQAIRMTFHALATRLIHNMKNSTLAMALALPVNQMELAGQAGRIAGQTFAWAEPLIIAAAIYVCISLALEHAAARVARRMGSQPETAG